MGIAGVNQSKGIHKYKVLIFTAWKHAHLQPTQAHPTISLEMLSSLVVIAIIIYIDKILSDVTFSEILQHQQTTNSYKLYYIFMIETEASCK